MTAQLAMNLPLARIERDTGIQRSADHAETVEPGWAAACYRVLDDYRRTAGEFTSETFRDHLAAIGFPCAVPKALGGIFQRAAREGLIRKVGYAKSRERHCSPVPLWRAA